MAKQYNILIVNDTSGRLVRLCGRIAEFHSLGSLNTMRGIGVYHPSVVIAEVTSVEQGIEFSNALVEEACLCALVFYGERGVLTEISTVIKRSVCVYVDSALDDDAAIARIVIAEQYLDELSKYRLAMNSMLMGEEQIKRRYFAALFTGGEDEYLRLQLETLGIVIPLRGCVIYGRTLVAESDCVEKCYSHLTELLAERVVLAECWQDRFVMIAASEDVAAIRGAVLDNATGGAERSEFVVGISVFTRTDGLKGAVKAAKTFVGDGLFWSAGGVYTDEDNIRVSGRKRHRLVSDTLKLISEHYDEKISAEWAAKQLFVSSSHLMHEFKSSLGYTFNDCLKRYRIMRAKDLLATGGFRVNEVARAVGFSDSRYFCNVFKSETGISPGEYIKRAQA